MRRSTAAVLSAIVVTAMPGGAANRAGIGYEDLWIVLRVAEMLEGKVSELRLEPLGGAGTGIELTVVAEGVSWGEQTKDSQRSWTINRLISEGVIADAKVQIADRGQCFRFVASSAAGELGTLAYRASKSETFAEYDEAIGSRLRDRLADLAREWRVSPTGARLLLRSVEVEHIPVDALKRIVESKLQLLYADDPDRVMDVVLNFCDQHIHETVNAPQASAHLESAGLVKRLIVADSNIIAGLSKSRERHAHRVDSAKPNIGLVARADVDAVVGLLREPDGAQVVVVDGRAGYGKSTVASEMATTLEAEGWFVAVARMDTDQSMSTSRDLGHAMGLSESPSVLLDGVSDGSSALLVVDQLDAVSLFGGRMSDNYDAVHEALDEIRRSPNVKVLLAARTADLDEDPRLRSLMRSEQGVDRHTLGDLDPEAVREHLVANGIEPPVSDSAMRLLCTPLHLAVFCRLSEEAHAIEHSTLQDLYARYTTEVRDRLELRLERLDWGPITRALVGHMSDNEVLAAPVGVLDSVERRQVRALVSESVIVKDGERYAFFHESYFDYLFARDFVAAGESLREFLLDSGQHLFRRAQTRQVLEHLVATAPQRFISVVVELLECDDIRYHLKVVVVGVLRQIAPAPEHWAALEDLAWSGSPLGARLLTLLCKPGWFDAADSLGRWETWLEDPQRAETARDELAIVAKQRPARASELIRARLEDSEQWRHHLRRIMWLSLCSELVDLISEAIAMGLFDDADRPTGGSGFWMDLHRLKDDDPAGTARLIGAFLGRGLERAKLDGSGDPFKSGHLRSDAQPESVIADVARKAPAEFVRHVLPFVIEVATADLHYPDGELPAGRWRNRWVSLVRGVDNVVFAATDNTLRALAEQDPVQCGEALQPLRSAEVAELRFLACRALATLGDSDDAVSWLVSDPRNLMLGSGGVLNSASRELIERCSPGCSTSLFDTLEVAILDHWPIWEPDESRGHCQYELLAALDSTRLSPTARQGFHQLEDRFPDWPPQPPQPAVWSGVVPSPIDGDVSEHMSDDDWIAALQRHTGDEPRWDGDRLVGGARQLASMLGDRAKDDPERFSRIALRFREDIPDAAMNAVIRNVESHVGVEVLTELCKHARRVYGPKVGRAVCSAISRADAVNSRLVALLNIYAIDLDPESEEARTEAFTGDYLYGGDFLTAGLNSTRGQAALSAATLLFRSADHVDALMPTVDALTQDDTVAVRVCAAEAVTALLNHAAPRALDLAERMFNADIAVLDAQTSERLLTHAVLRDPDRFAPTLAEAIAGPEDIAVRAGRIWAVARWRERLPAGIDTDVCALPAAARRGAVEAFASNVADSLEDLRSVFDDDDSEVQANLGTAILRLDAVPASEMEDLIDALSESSAFPQHMDSLMYALEQLPADMPTNAITACERAVEITGAGLADPSTSLTGLHLTRVVLRLYRQGDQDARVRCLDIIDRLFEFNLYDLEPTLDSER